MSAAAAAGAAARWPAPPSLDGGSGNVELVSGDTSTIRRERSGGGRGGEGRGEEGCWVWIDEDWASGVVQLIRMSIL